MLEQLKSEVNLSAVVDSVTVLCWYNYKIFVHFCYTCTIKAVW